ncbi:GGDEF domain-containing protein [Limosilactobacillus reuteri]|uniref:GGDEF domain-containing protein n=1 Tax=Limosilactobacillus reuteri TaxID=1598 RepID=UPI001E4E0B08|nr:GGDEF domain-containing protein [Limosilactobacillus reuteri]MCC4341695.1 GGDEF domain-containing protein [Limosilactobacillus reuteri]
MALKLFYAILYLPIIVICMIISQIYFERYWVSYKNSRLTSWGLGAVIIITYFIQEFCLFQLSLFNIGQVVFMQVVSVTMLFRDKVYKIWWALLALTPLFVNVVEYLMGILSLKDWWYWIVESIVFTTICLVLTRWRSISKRISYFYAIASLGIVELVSLGINHSFSPVSVAAATLGLFVIAMFEEQRFYSEKKNEQKIKLLEKESERDDLTGLLNYRALSQEINRLANNSEIHNIVIGALDIDHFKKINDTYGHFVGNEVLNYFSTVFREQIHSAFPKHGYVYRFGGEEFTIVVSNHSLEKVYQLLQSIEKFFNNKSIVTKEGMKLTISFSCSLTDRLNDELLDTTLKRADKMLYSVKNNGRGWIVTDQHHQRPQKPSLERKINNNY